MRKVFNWKQLEALEYSITKFSRRIRKKVFIKSIRIRSFCGIKIAEEGLRHTELYWTIVKIAWANPRRNIKILYGNNYSV